MAKLTRVVLHYTVSRGSSGNYYDFQASDEFHIDAANPMLNNGEKGLFDLMNRLLDASTRGGGTRVGKAVYSDAFLEVYETREMEPPRVTTTEKLYMKDFDGRATSLTMALQIEAANYREEELAPSELEDRKNELRKNFNKYRGLNRRDASSDKIRNERRKIDRAYKRQQALLADGSKTRKEIESSPQFKKVAERLQRARLRLERIEELKTRNTTLQNVYASEIKNIEQMEKYHARQEREKTRRVNERLKEMQKRHRLYHTGQRPTRPHDLNKTRAQVIAEVERELEHEYRLAHDHDYADAHQRERDERLATETSAAVLAARAHIMRRVEEEEERRRREQEANNGGGDMPTN